MSCSGSGCASADARPLARIRGLLPQGNRNQGYDNRQQGEARRAHVRSCRYMCVIRGLAAPAAAELWAVV